MLFRSFHLDDGEPGQKLNLKETLRDPGPDKHLYVCGPVAFLEFVRTAAQGAGWPEDHVHFEYFAAPSDPQAGASQAFEVLVSRSGQNVVVHEHESIVAALARCGVDIPVMCEQGVCGSCLTKVLEGIPDHRDFVLSAEERAANDRMLPCCSRSLSPRLILDL